MAACSSRYACIPFSNSVFSHVWCCLPKAYSIVDMNDSQFKVSEEDLQKPVNYAILKNYLWWFGGAPFPTAKDHGVPWYNVGEIEKPLSNNTELYDDISWDHI